MKIVIDIPEDRYEDTKRIASVQMNYRAPTIEQIVANGAPIPKGHGRLIDADAFIENEGCCGYIEDMDIDTFNLVTPTIIEADKAESEG